MENNRELHGLVIVCEKGDPTELLKKIDHILKEYGGYRDEPLKTAGTIRVFTTSEGEKALRELSE